MSKSSHRVGRAALAALLGGLLLGSAGCAVGMRVYDPEYGVYHSWDRNEESEFRIFLGERHEPYRQFHSLDESQQREYWKWRHARGEGDHH